jgi:small-conductance mechanosensitive channel
MQAQEIGDQYLIRHEFIKRLRRRYQQEGITIPYPVQTVHVREPHEPDAALPASDGASAAQASSNSSEASSR